MDLIKRIIKSKGFLAFIMGFVFYIIIVLPELIAMDGVLLGSGDYNYQSLPFIFHVRSSVLEGNIFWDHTNGIGNQFLSSYAYYNLFSPFTAIYFLIPESVLLYAIPYVTALKYGVGAMLTYFYLKRYFSSAHYAVIGGLLYIFSTFTAYNQVFHFLDVIALFPLLLLAMDELCINNRKGVFALSVALMAFVNYYFFFGQALFLIIYYFVGCTDKQSGRKLKSLLYVSVEAVIGCLIAMPVFMPVLCMLLSNEKATSTIALADMFTYHNGFNYLKIIQSAFMIPDPFAYTSLFIETERSYPYGVLLASVAAYIPLFSAAGVISYMWAKKKSWQTYMLLVSVVIAFVPVLNQMFFAFNSSYYARWYYMPLLIGVMVSLKALDEKISFKPGIIACSAVLAGFLLFWLFYDFETEFTKGVGISSTSESLTIIHFLITVISLVMLIICARMKRDKEFFPKLYIFSFIGIYMAFGIMTYYTFTDTGGADKKAILDTFNYNEEIPEDIDKSERFSIKAGVANYNMYWDVDSIMCFNSIYDNGFSEFLTETGKVAAGGVFDMPDIEDRPICDLLSVKYFMSASEITEESDNVAFCGMFDEYYIYENLNYIPMGFTYDTMISAEEYQEIEDDMHKQDIYLKHLVVEDTDEFSDLLTVCNEDASEEISSDEYAQLIERCKTETCYDLEKSTKGIKARIDMSRENVVFFSLSYNDNWKAYVDGIQTSVYKVNNGMIGVIVPEGEHGIELEYSVKGLGDGVIISIASIVVFIVYIILCKRKDNKHAR
ncbi:MAG: YfhO family protein [Ruminiclostridium sp.]|nr:YfhO family protein [Ruminiclostridium sp.]